MNKVERHEWTDADLRSAYEVLTQYGAEKPSDNWNRQRFILEVDGTSWITGMESHWQYSDFTQWKEDFDNKMKDPTASNELKQHYKKAMSARKEREKRQKEEKTDTDSATPPSPTPQQPPTEPQAPQSPSPELSAPELPSPELPSPELPAPEQSAKWYEDYEKVKLFFEVLASEGFVESVGDLTQWRERLEAICTDYELPPFDTFKRGKDLLVALRSAKEKREKAQSAESQPPAETPPPAVNPPAQKPPVAAAFPQTPPMRSPFSNMVSNIGWLRSIEEAMSILEKIARMLEKAKALSHMGANEPPDVRIARAVIAMIIAMQMGLPPTAGIEHVQFVNGRVTISAQLIAARARQRGLRIEVIRADEEVAEIKATRADTGESQTVKWTRADAEKAGLTEKPIWQKYRRQMLLVRAMKEAASRTVPDALLDMPAYSPEELGPEELDGEEPV